MNAMAGPGRDVLRAAALLGMDFAVTDLAIVLGRNVTDLITLAGAPGSHLRMAPENRSGADRSLRRSAFPQLHDLPAL